MPAARVAIFEHPNVATHMRAVAVALRERGHEIITASSIAAYDAALASNPQLEALLISSGYPCTTDRLRQLPQLRGVTFIGSGTESIDLAAATELGIVVAHGVSEDNTDSMAEATILLILASLYQLARSERIARTDWSRPDAPYAFMLKRKVLGLIGFGRIARAIASRLTAWEVDIVASSHRPIFDLPTGVREASIDDVLRNADILSLHSNVDPAQPQVLSAERLALLKPGAILINTARGKLVDEPALIEALDQQRIGGVALDTFSVEPLPSSSPLLALNKTILTPHMVGHTIEGAASVIAIATENIDRILRNEVPLAIRNPEILPTPPEASRTPGATSRVAS